MGINEAIKEIRELREHDEKIEMTTERNAKYRDKINKLNHTGAQFALRFLVNRIDDFDDEFEKVLSLAISLGEDF